jgi:hypothetical protein
MLFDLRGRGRRRTVQAIYLTLAVLMGGGLVFFGIGGEVSGGLFDAIGLTNNSGTTTSSSELLERQEKTAVRRVRANPRDERGWAVLARIRYQQAAQGDNYVEETGEFKAGGLRELRGASQAWERYMALEPRRPDPNIATLMLQTYGPAGLNRPKQGLEAAEIVAKARPAAQTSYQLALFAYAAKQNKRGDRAARETVRLTPAPERPAVRKALRAARKAGGFGPAPGAG